MCDRPQLPVRPAHAVSVKELARATASILRAVELDGDVVVLSRRGTMVALLTPLPERTIVEIRSEGRSIEEEPEEISDVPTGLDELDPLAKALLADALAAYPMAFSIGNFVQERKCGASAAAMAYGRLELGGLMENALRGRRPTREGLAAARWLDSTQPPQP